MRGEPAENDRTNVSRRTFVKASGALVGAGLMGGGAVGTAAADADVGPLDDRLLNWRVAEAKKVWERGYRGRPDRTLGLTDTGIEARHPDLGPWNGIRVRPGGTDVALQHVVRREEDVPVPERSTFDERRYSGTVVGAEGLGVGDTETEPFDLEAQPGEDVLGHGIDAVLTWNVESPEAQPTALQWTLQRRDGDEWTDVEVRGNWWTETVQEDNRFEMVLELPADETYRFVIQPARGAIEWEIDLELQALVDTGETRRETVRHVSSVDDAGLPDPDEEITTETPKTVGWYSEIPDYGGYEVPRDPHGHGSHVSGIMTATGRASVLDPDRTSVHEPHAILLPGDFLEYDVEARAGTGVFVSALGEGVIVEVEHDGRVLDAARPSGDATIADAPTVHESGEETYTVRVKPAETEAVAPVVEDAQRGTPTVAQVHELAVGAFKRPSETVGQRVETDETVVHPGIAPNFSLAGFVGLGDPVEDLGDIADAATAELNLRAVNMSWGPLLGVPVNAFGAAPIYADAVRAMVDAGILPVAAAGNSWTPANGNGEPAAVGEAVSVVATDPFDGITGYSSGGVGTLDEAGGFDGKPDVTAPGGDLKPDAVGTILLGSYADAILPVDVYADSTTPTPDTAELIRATATADPEEEFAEHPPRDHRDAGGTSMASPYVCGVAGLVSQAMEEDAPASIAMPVPDETDFEDVMRLKQVLLATASTTAFTAAPYHNAQFAPSPAAYAHGERDPYEGYGRVNPDAAVDAVTRDLLGDGDVELGGDTATASYRETVGLDVPFDSRAVAGYARVPGGTLRVDLTFGSYSGGNAGMARGDPHLDLFVYDAENPGEDGEPTIVDSAIGEDGTASVSVAVDRGSAEDPTERTLFVVAKLVNVPGVVNGFDVQANFDLAVAFDPADDFPQPAFSAAGTREVDSSVYFGRQATRVEVTVEDVDDDARVYDHVPEGWRLLERFSDAAVADQDGGRIRLFHRDEGDDSPGEDDTVSPDESETFVYFVESPSDLGESGPSTFGPGLAEAVDDEAYDPAQAEFAGTDDALVVAVDV